MAEATQEMIGLARQLFADHKGWGNNAPFWNDLRKGLDSGVFDREPELRIALAAIQATTERASALNARQSGEGERLREALFFLASAEAEYRRLHDLHGDGDIRTGRAWDRMRRRGDEARAALRATDDAGGA